MISANMSTSIDVHDRRVLVTAGASGIGLAIAKKFRESGARVHISDVSEDSLNCALSGVEGMTGTCGDAASASDADRVLDDVMSQLGGLDVLINNVGIAGPTGGIDTYTDADVERTIDVNLKSHFYFLKRFVPLIKASAARDSSIIAVGSVAGRLAYGFRTPYSATKWAIVGLIKSLAVELGPVGVRVNAILPGVVKGERMDHVIHDRATALGVSDEEMTETYLRKISLRRMVEADDIAHLALFLSSDLGRNISGQAISVDGHVEYL